MATSDDDVREIHLSGKQLVFLFMAVTVVSVVIFLCGVLVGRGVQARVTPTAGVAAPQAPADAAPDPTAPAAVPATPPAEPTKATGLGYQERLEAAGPPPEKLAPRPDAPAPKVPATSPPRPAPSQSGASAAAAASPRSPAPDAPSAAFAEPGGDGFAIQVAALTGRAEAEAVASRLKSKGYAAYLMPALPGQPAGYRVRVGKFKTRVDAEKVAQRLERDEQFKPWITR